MRSRSIFPRLPFAQEWARIPEDLNAPMRIPEFLTRPRQRHRTLALACGVLGVAGGIAIGWSHGFTGWPGGMMLVGMGLAFIAAGCFLSESLLEKLFAFAVLVNVLAAAYVLMFAK